jgi:hypothetical protein
MIGFEKQEDLGNGGQENVSPVAVNGRDMTSSRIPVMTRVESRGKTQIILPPELGTRYESREAMRTRKQR